MCVRVCVLKYVCVCVLKYVCVCVLKYVCVYALKYVCGCVLKYVCVYRVTQLVDITETSNQEGPNAQGNRHNVTCSLTVKCRNRKV